MVFCYEHLSKLIQKIKAKRQGREGEEVTTSEDSKPKEKQPVGHSE